jgi:hypothetical protein
MTAMTTTMPGMGAVAARAAASPAWASDAAASAATSAPPARCQVPAAATAAAPSGAAAGAADAAAGAGAHETPRAAAAADPSAVDLLPPPPAPAAGAPSVVSVAAAAAAFSAAAAAAAARIADSAPELWRRGTLGCAPPPEECEALPSDVTRGDVVARSGRGDAAADSSPPPPRTVSRCSARGARLPAAPLPRRDSISNPPSSSSSVELSWRSGIGSRRPDAADEPRSWASAPVSTLLPALRMELAAPPSAPSSPPRPNECDSSDAEDGAPPAGLAAALMGMLLAGTQATGASGSAVSGTVAPAVTTALPLCVPTALSPLSLTRGRRSTSAVSQGRCAVRLWPGMLPSSPAAAAVAATAAAAAAGVAAAAAAGAGVAAAAGDGVAAAARAGGAGMLGSEPSTFHSSLADSQELVARIGEGCCEESPPSSARMAAAAEAAMPAPREPLSPRACWKTLGVR